MKSKIYSALLLIIFLILFQNNSSSANIEKINYINIKITRPITNKQIVNLGSSGGFSIYEKSDKETPLYEISKDSLRVMLDANGDIALLDINDETVFTFPKGNSFLMGSSNLEENTIKIEKDKYRGYLYFKNTSGVLELVNHVDIEEYLYGLVPREMPSSFPIEALKAQAVAARTYANHNLNKHIKDGYNLCDTTHCQVYSGYDGEKPTTTKAVDDTRGMLAIYEGGTIDAQYHSTSSGHTNSSVEVWGGDLPYLVGVEDDFSSEAPYSKWETTLDMIELNNRLILYSINIGSLERIEVGNVSQDGNVETIVLTGTLGSKEIKGSQFRSIAGNTDVKSTNFVIKNQLASGVNASINSKYLYVMDANRDIVSVDMKNVTIIDAFGRKKISSTTSRAIDMNNKEANLGIAAYGESFSALKIVLEGKGHGHGVGMSQYGAKRMAELGYDFKEILKHYYTGIDIL